VLNVSVYNECNVLPLTLYEKYVYMYGRGGGRWQWWVIPENPDPLPSMIIPENGT
jgi:hypothetical protein